MGNIEVAPHLIHNKKFHVNTEDKEKRTALHFACFHGHLHLVIPLFNDCEINVLDDEKSTPLMKYCTPLCMLSWSSESGYEDPGCKDFFSVLLDNRAHPVIKDSNGETEYSTQYKLTVKITTSLLEFGRNIEQSTMVTVYYWKINRGKILRLLFTSHLPSRKGEMNVPMLPASPLKSYTFLC